MNDLFFKDLKYIEQDAQQLSALNSNRNTVVIAGPGSGKTRILTMKAMILIQSRIKRPSGIACISYNRETVRELRKRLKKYGYNLGNKDFIGTMHGFSLVHVLQQFAHLYPQYRVPEQIVIAPRTLIDQLYQGVLKELNITSKDLTLTELNRQRCLSLEGYSSIVILSSKYAIAAAKIYEEKLINTNHLDFISIINIAAQIIREQPFVRHSLECRFPWLLIDEYQDLGKALHEMVLELVFNADINVFAVGDMNQSIYGFNGGYPDFLKELANYDEITPIYLSSNYRSNQEIIEASLDTLSLDPPRPNYKSRLREKESANFSFIICNAEMDQQFEVVAKKVIPKLVKEGVPLEEIGIIAASNRDVKAMAIKLKENSISFYIAKWDFDNSNIVVWLQDCAEWCINSEKQLFNNLFRFWKRLLIEEADHRCIWEDIRLKMFFHDVLIHSRAFKEVESWLHYILESLDLINTLKKSKIYPDEIENLDLLVDEARFHNLKNVPLRRFAYLGEPEKEVTISTRHSSKGLEFEVVILLGMEEERFPSYFSIGDADKIAEEQRLCYVCVSRAKSSCILIRSKIHTLQTRRGAWEKPFQPSRFWVSLISKFGTDLNTFDDKDY